MKNIIYVCDGDVSVYESQVLSLLRYLNSLQDTHVILVQGYRSVDERHILEKKLSNGDDMDVVWVRSYPMYRIFSHFTVSNYYRAIKSIGIDDNTVLHVRSEYTGYLIFKVRNKLNIKFPLLIDIRGIVKEELEYKRNKIKGVRRFLCTLQKRFCDYYYETLFNSNADNILITSVSPIISNYLFSHYPLSPSLLFVNPNIVGSQFVFSKEKRRVVRNKYGINDNQILAICSTGGAGVWQQDFKVIPELIKAGLKVINLSKKDWGIKECITTTVPFTDMPDMLSAADVAVLWRDDTFMNNSASPSKFSEFATMGLFVIHNGSVSIANDYIRETGAGTIVQKVEDVKDVDFSLICEEKRLEWISAGRKRFGIENIGTSYTKMYNKLLNNKTKA